MFTEDQVLLDISYEQARARLAWLTGTRLLHWACESAYGEGIGVLVAGTGPASASRLIQVRTGELASRCDRAQLPIRWEAIAAGGSVFPALDAELMVVPAGEGTAVLSMASAWRQPPGCPAVDRPTAAAAAAAAARGFLGRLACVLAHPASGAVPGHPASPGGAGRLRAAGQVA